MKIMSVDYGDARTGIAFCDKNEILASAYTTINESYQPKLVEKIKSVIDKEKPDVMLVHGDTTTSFAALTMQGILPPGCKAS